MRIKLEELRKNQGDYDPALLRRWADCGRIERDWLVADEGGWGDRLHCWLAPFVRFLDRRLRTHLSTCSGCRRRQARLNRLEIWVRSRLTFRKQ